MRKKVICIAGGVFAVLFFLALCLFLKKSQVFALEDKYYKESKVTEISSEELNELVEKKESFLVFVYQPMCITSSDFGNILNTFLSENTLSIYKIAFSELKEINSTKNVKYYPSFLIYKKGALVDFLEANKDEDVKYYTNKEEFKKWITKYVQLKNTSDFVEKVNKNDLEENKIEDEEIEMTNLENVKKEKGKVNIYFFWGDGCPHCEHEKEFFKSIEEEYSKLYNLHLLEVWHNKENEKLLKKFAKEMDMEVTGVPYTVIGEQAFKGFGESSQEKFKSAIKSEAKKKF